MSESDTELKRPWLIFAAICMLLVGASAVVAYAWHDEDHDPLVEIAKQQEIKVCEAKNAKPFWKFQRGGFATSFQSFSCVDKAGRIIPTSRPVCNTMELDACREILEQRRRQQTVTPTKQAKSKEKPR